MSAQTPGDPGVRLRAPKRIDQGALKTLALKYRAPSTSAEILRSETVKSPLHAMLAPMKEARVLPYELTELRLKFDDRGLLSYVSGVYTGVVENRGKTPLLLSKLEGDFYLHNNTKWLPLYHYMERITLIPPGRQAEYSFEWGVTVTSENRRDITMLVLIILTNGRVVAADLGELKALRYHAKYENVAIIPVRRVLVSTG